MKKLCDEDPKETIPTEGFNVKQIMQGDFKLNMWDIGGQEAIRPYWKDYCSETDILIYFVDASDRKRVEESGLQLFALLEEETLKKVPVLVFANKQDLDIALKPAEVAKGVNLHMITDRNWHIQGCSALTGSGLSDGLDWALREYQSGV